MNPRFLQAIFLQFSGIVGSGIFVLPYLFHRSNFLFATLCFLFLTFVTILLNLFYLDIIFSTKGDHQLTGYVSKYLGKKARSLSILNLFILSLGAVIAYQKLFTRFGLILFPELSPSIIFLTYVLLLTLFFIFKIGFKPTLTIIFAITTLAIPILLFVLSQNTSSLLDLSIIPNLSFYGGALFALSGFTILPEVEEILRKSPSSRTQTYRASIFGTVLASLVMLIFAYSVTVLSNSNPTVDSLTGLSRSLPLFATLASIFGLLVLFRASLNFLVILREVFYRDLHFPPWLSSILPFMFPLASYMLQNISFITVISITGHITIFISALLICLIRLRLNKTFFTQFSFLTIMISLALGLISGF